MQKINFLFILLFNCLLYSENYVLMVSFDGFRYDYTEMANTPNFDKIAKKGVKAKSLIPVFPSLTFPNHYSIATGSYSGTHNITGNSFYDKKLNKGYSLYKKDTVRDSSFYKSEPIWATAERQGLKSASYFWVGSEAPIKGYSPSIFKYYDGSVPFESRIDSIVSWFKLPKFQRPDLAMLYFSEPDQTGHNFGIDNLEIISTIEKMDSLLGYLLNELENLEIYTELNIIIVSDHGMSNVSKERRIVVEDYLDSHLSKIDIRGKGAYMQLDINLDNKLDISAFKNDLEKIPNVRVWEKNDIPERFHFINHNTGDILILADEGWLLTTKKDYNKSTFSLGGMHGYDPKILNMHGIFYAFGADINKNIVLSSFENIHIYPLICELLGIKPYSGDFDSSEGDIQVLKHILKNDK